MSGHHFPSPMQLRLIQDAARPNVTARPVPDRWVAVVGSLASRGLVTIRHYEGYAYYSVTDQGRAWLATNPEPK